MSGRRWTSEERELVASLRFPDDEGLYDLAELLGRTPKAIVAEYYRQVNGPYAGESRRFFGNVLRRSSQ